MIVVFLLVVALGALVLWAVTQPVFSEEEPLHLPRPVDVEALRTDVFTLVDDYFPRDHTHPEILEAAASFIESELQRTGATVTSQPVIVDESAGKVYRNVIASFGPDDGPRVVLGAHYDAFEELPAADDNASGVAILLETARLLGEGARPTSRIDLVAYVLEEPPYFRSELMGSAVHAGSLREQDVELEGVVVLDTIGYFTDEPGTQGLPTALLRPFYPSRGDFVAVVGEVADRRLVRRVKRSLNAAMSIHAFSFTAPRIVPGVDFSDHLSYWQQGYSAVLLSDTAFHRNTAYHTAADTPDRLNYDSMAQVVKGLYQTVLSLSAADATER